MGNMYGYMRVSSEKQNEDRQRRELVKYGVPEKHLYTDKLSGKDFNRPAWKKLVKRLKQGDTLVIKSLDRLGNSWG